METEEDGVQLELFEYRADGDYFCGVPDCVTCNPEDDSYWCSDPDCSDGRL